MKLIHKTNDWVHKVCSVFAITFSVGCLIHSIKYFRFENAPVLCRDDLKFNLVGMFRNNELGNVICWVLWLDLVWLDSKIWIEFGLTWFGLIWIVLDKFGSIYLIWIILNWFGLFWFWIILIRLRLDFDLVDWFGSIYLD